MDKRILHRLGGNVHDSFADMKYQVIHGVDVVQTPLQLLLLQEFKLNDVSSISIKFDIETPLIPTGGVESSRLSVLPG